MTGIETVAVVVGFVSLFAVRKMAISIKITLIRRK